MPLTCAEETEQPNWRKASYCASGECIEAAWHGTGGVVLVRDSKQPASGNLALTPAQWRGLLTGIKSGRYGYFDRFRP
jgi:hypothetical protein